MSSTKARRPLTVRSNESTKKQLAFARAEGDSIDRCLQWIRSQTGGLSGQLRAGEYLITYALSGPEGWYLYNNKAVEWSDAGSANAHLWLFVQDGADGRIVPPLHIKLTVRSETGTLAQQLPLDYAWMPLVNGYGNNLQLPGPNRYHFQVNIDPPAYHRHDPYNGDRFTDAVTGIFDLVVTGLDLSVLSSSMEMQQDLSRHSGMAYENTLQAMYEQANDGRDTLSGDYRVAYALEYSEGYWYMRKGRMTYNTENELSGEHNAHLEVAVLDRVTGRFMFDLMVTATLFKESGDPVGTQAEMFMWHPWLYHYGENWRVPKAGIYSLKVHIDPPAYRRYGKIAGKQFTSPIDMSFDHLQIKTGQK